ncbi:Caleosin related protein-domain-containing protein [Ampelomyces quisqualis]|uniref:Caleosin related protein-domain-containing protein n=1 Tax=Ampelomyces quisqualis TaxID=50730 RepID=A0A6A5QLU2_AMPQU|nr:Caleosin related protein-domain-containing protein [Ampelomyces quisqualis]
MPAKMVYTDGDAKGDVNGDTSYPFATSIAQEPCTISRKPYIPSKNSKLVHPGTARANLAASEESPHGTLTNNWAATHAHQTVLQQHCDFFDQDHDGIIWPSDTFTGFHRLGFGLVLSLLAACIIHVNFSYATATHWLPDPLLRINLVNAHRTKHGGDSGAYDAEGRFVPQKFEEIFTKFAGGRGYLTFWEGVGMLRAWRNVNDVVGWGGATFEWGATWLMLWPEDGRMLKEDIRATFDGSIFYVIAERRAKGLRSTPTSAKF